MSIAAVTTPGDVRDPGARFGNLLDAGSIAALPGRDTDGVLAVRGRIDGVPVIAYCTDAALMGGAISFAGARRIVDAIDTALSRQVPVLGVWHSGGARLADGVESMHGVGCMFAAMTRASGKVPQISVVVGPAAGAAAYGPGLTDVVVMAPAGRVFITGPQVVRGVTGEQIDMAGLGGPEAHAKRSGVAHLTAESEQDAYAQARQLVAFFGEPGVFDVPAAPGTADPGAVLPASPRQVYDIRFVITAVLDETGFQELQPKWAPNMVIGFGRPGGRTVGVVANNPLRKGGCLDSFSAEKAARFVRMRDAFGIPLMVVVDVPGYLPGVGQERDGVVRRGAKLLHVFAESIVPRVTVITRKSYGGAYIAMNSRSLGAGHVFAWPAGEVAVMGAEAAVDILYRKRLASAPEHERETLRGRFVEEHRRVAGGVDRARELGVVDEVINPEDTRTRVAAALAAMPVRRGQHGNIPL